MARVKKVAKAVVEVVARFVVSAKNILTDQKTGLMIIQDPTLLGEVFKNKMTWDEANKAIDGLNVAGYGGFKDWRMPTVEELVGMTDRTRYAPCYDINTFKGKFNDWYWTKETCFWNKGAAWCVYSGYGFVSDGDKYGHNYVRPVRASQCQFDNLAVSQK